MSPRHFDIVGLPVRLALILLAACGGEDRQASLTADSVAVSPQIDARQHGSHNDAYIRPWKMGSGSTMAAPLASDQAVYLEVPYDAQRQSNWCWAASGGMVLSFLGRPTTQCQQANARFRGAKVPKDADCCNPLQCNWPGFPEFGDLAFQYRDEKPLTWEELTNQLRHGIPVAFSWFWKGGGEHMLVAIGFTTAGSQRWVYVHDPAPDVRQPPFIPYERYVEGVSYEHARDYFMPQFASAP
jgi:hypothetical protein